MILGYFVFICRASRICSRSLLILCAIIVMFSTRIFRNLDLGNRMDFKMLGYGARIIKVHSKPSWKSWSGQTNIRIIFLGDTVSQRTIEYIYDIYPIKKFSGGGSVIGNNSFGSFKFFVVNDKSYLLAGSVGKTFFGVSFFFLVYGHLSYIYYGVNFCSKNLLIVYGLGYCICYVQFY